MTESVRWHSAKEAAAVTGYSERSLRRWASAGEIWAQCSPGGVWRVALNTVGELLEPPRQQ